MLEKILEGVDTIYQGGVFGEEPVTFTNASITAQVFFDRVDDTAKLTVDGKEIVFSPQAVANGMPGFKVLSEVPPYIVEFSAVGREIKLEGKGSYIVSGKTIDVEKLGEKLREVYGIPDIEDALVQMLQAFNNFAVTPVVVRVRR